MHLESVVCREAGLLLSQTKGPKSTAVKASHIQESSPSIHIVIKFWSWAAASVV